MPHDVFVSYAHKDDAKPFGAKDGWITTFVEELKKLLQMKMPGAGPDVFMDHQLVSNAQVTSTLLDKIKSSRTILLFLSPNYLSSKWCQLEIGQFLEVNHADKNQESVFIVELDKTDRETWHLRHQELTPLVLFKQESSGARTRLGYPRPPEGGDNDYWKNLNELAHFISEHLNLLSQSDPQTKQPAATIRIFTDKGQTSNISDISLIPKSPTVWIAQPSKDLYKEWEGLASVIRQQGANILPLGHSIYPLSSAEGFQCAVEHDLSKADLFVQLLSTETGDRITGSSANTNSLQSLLAKTHREKDSRITFLQWRSIDIMLDTISDSKCRELLQGTIASGFTQFSRQVLEALYPLLRPTTISSDTTQPGENLSLCITAGPKDSALCNDIATIIQSLGHTPMPAPPAPGSDQSPEEYRTQFEELLGDVNGVILAHSRESEIWLQSRYAQVRKIFAQRGQKTWGALVDGPPPEKTKILWPGTGFIQLDCKNGLKREPIQVFIERLLSEMPHV